MKIGMLDDKILIEYIGINIPVLDSESKQHFVWEQLLWEYTQDFIIEAFELILKDGDGAYDYDDIDDIRTFIINENKKIEFGLCLFAKYYRSLWD